MSDKLLKQFLAAAEEAGITHMAPTQADRLAEQIKDISWKMENNLIGAGHVTLCKAVDAIAALAKQQASPDAQPVAETFSGFHGTTVKWLSPFPIPSGTKLYTIPPSAPQQASPEAQQEWKVGNTVTIRPTRMEVFTTPSAPQAAGADERDGQRPGYPETSRDWLAALVDIWDDMQNNAPEDRAYVPEALSESIDKARAHLSITLPQVREQAALPAEASEALMLAREYVVNASERGYDGTNGRGIRQEAKRRLALIDSAIAQGTTPAAGMGEQATGVDVLNDIANATESWMCEAGARQMRSLASDALLSPKQAQADPHAPKEVFLQLYGDSSADEGQVDYETGDVSWCWHRIYDSDVRYVQAAAKAEPMMGNDE